MKLNFLSQEARIEAQYEQQEKRLYNEHGKGQWIAAFAWLPTRIDAKTMIWWENYEYRLAGFHRLIVTVDNGFGPRPAYRTKPVFEYRRSSKE